jgi:hypothetical protein
MKKILYCIWGIAFLLLFESCSKEKLQPKTNNKGNTTQQPQSAEQNPPPSQQPPTCPQAPACPHAPCGSAG